MWSLPRLKWVPLLVLVLVLFSFPCHDGGLWAVCAHVCVLIQSLALLCLWLACLVMASPGWLSTAPESARHKPTGWDSDAVKANRIVAVVERGSVGSNLTGCSDHTFLTGQVMVGSTP